jgi:lysophospholipase L1-like esterase
MGQARSIVCSRCSNCSFSWENQLRPWNSRESDQLASSDFVIVEFTINDASLWHGMTLDKSRDRHREILKAAVAAGLPVFLATMSPAFGREALERPGQVAYRALYPDLARAEGAGLIAMVPGWQALTPDERRAALPDGLHPTDAAMAQVAVPALTAALVPVLEPCRR